MPVHKSGARLAISYGYVPCMLGLCGPRNEKKRKIIARYLKEPKKLDAEIRKILEDFKGAYPYYKLISQSNGISDPLDYRVVEAYWLGNSLLKKVKVSDFKKMMKEEFLPLGKMSASKIRHLPVKAIPSHNLHVLFIGSVTGRFKETQAGLDLCRVSWGKVKKIEKNEITIARQSLKFGEKITLDEPVEKIVRWNKHILPEVKPGDWISMHWNTAIEKLNPLRLKNMIKYNQDILKIISKKSGD